jgi:hypothetical protein
LANDRHKQPVSSASPALAWARRLCSVGFWVSALAICGCGNLATCGSGQRAAQSHPPPPASATVETSVQREGERKKKAARKASGRRAKRATVNLSSGTAWRALAFFVPDVLDGYRARTATEGRDLMLGAGIGFVSVKRAYSKDNVQLELELIDTAHCERVRDVFNRSRELQREADSVVIRPLKIQGQKALAQWLDSTRVARTSVLVADRFLLNANVKPADSPEPSIALLQKLDWDALEKLAAQPASALEASADVLDGRPAPGAANGSEEATRATGSESPDSSLLAIQPQ